MQWVRGVWWSLTGRKGSDEPWKGFHWGERKCEIHSRRISGDQCGERTRGGETDAVKRGGGPNLGTGHREEIGRDSIEGKNSL